MNSNKKKFTLSAALIFGFIAFICFQMSSGQQVEQKRPQWRELGATVEASEIDSSQYPIFTRWLDEFGKVPINYALEKCREHQVVIFGELHGIKDYLDFFLELISEAYHKAGMRYVILEVCKHEDNGKIEKLVEGETYDRDLALEIARSGPWATWNSKEYWDIFEIVWKLNKSLPAGAEHMKVIGMDVSADLPLNFLYQNNKLEDKKLLEKARVETVLLSMRDELMAAAIEAEVIRKQSKGMVWVGANHSFTHYAQPQVNKDGILVREWPRLANLLYQKYKNRIFQICMHSPYVDSPQVILEKYKGEKPVLGTLIEKIMAERGNKPVGSMFFPLLLPT